jgi:4-hydroxy-tetrahydrodipicolinate reductase
MQEIKVMVNGLPGNMAQVVARHVLTDPRFALVPFSLTGAEITAASHDIGGTAVGLIQPHLRQSLLEKIGPAGLDLISVDYTHPSAVNDNARFYCENGLPFVMGTTGGDRRGLEDTVKASSVAAVIAPNMAKQIVGFQAMMEYAADNFPNLFRGYALTVRESHQKGKADTSGTAKAMVAYFNALGTPFSEDRIEKERRPDVQRDQWGIPEAYLSGHGWHTYRLVSADGTVRFEFTHNVNGREIYAGGTLDAVAFLHRRLKAGARGQVFSMVDVLRGD